MYARAALAALLIVPAGLSACGGERSAEAFCATFEEKNAEARERFEGTVGASKATGDEGLEILGTVGATFGAIGDVAVMFDDLEKVAPEEIHSDIVVVRDSLRQQIDAAGSVASDPLGAVFGGLVSGLTTSGSWSRVDAYIASTCQSSAGDPDPQPSAAGGSQGLDDSESSEPSLSHADPGVAAFLDSGLDLSRHYWRFGDRVLMTTSRGQDGRFGYLVAYDIDSEDFAWATPLEGDGSVSLDGSPVMVSDGETAVVSVPVLRPDAGLQEGYSFYRTYGIDAETGQTVWVADRPGATAVVSGGVLLGSGNGSGAQVTWSADARTGDLITSTLHEEYDEVPSIERERILQQILDGDYGELLIGPRGGSEAFPAGYSYGETVELPVVDGQLFSSVGPGPWTTWPLATLGPPSPTGAPAWLDNWITTDDHVVGVLDGEDEISAVAPTGEVSWRTGLASVPGVGLDTFYEIFHDPDGGVLIVDSGAGPNDENAQVFAIDPSSGAVLWDSGQLGATARLDVVAVGNGWAVVDADSSDQYAVLDTGTGKLVGGVDTAPEQLSYDAPANAAGEYYGAFLLPDGGVGVIDGNQIVREPLAQFATGGSG